MQRQPVRQLPNQSLGSVTGWQILGKCNPIWHEAETAADAAKPLIRRQEARRKAKAKAGTEKTTGGEWWRLLLLSCDSL